MMQFDFASDQSGDKSPHSKEASNSKLIIETEPVAKDGRDALNLVPPWSAGTCHRFGLKRREDALQGGVQFKIDTPMKHFLVPCSYSPTDFSGSSDSKGEDSEITIVNYLRSSLFLRREYSGCRLAAVARSGSQRRFEGDRAAQTMAGWRTETALASE
ncbi:MAG TPA: hypothetical protein VGJ37_09715 [Pyrinomonadaceae bacterium]|jgi:hypothetical protein